jgi:hypothetical protein
MGCITNACNDTSAVFMVKPFPVLKAIAKALWAA